MKQILFTLRFSDPWIFEEKNCKFHVFRASIKGCNLKNIFTQAEFKRKNTRNLI